MVGLGSARQGRLATLAPVRRDDDRAAAHGERGAEERDAADGGVVPAEPLVLLVPEAAAERMSESIASALRRS